MMQRFSSAIRDHVRQKIEGLRMADIVIGIPAYQSGPAIVHVIRTVAQGLKDHYPDAKALIMIADGGSTDDTRDLARSCDVKSFNIDKIVTIYRGLPGKGSALRAAFEVAAFLKPKAMAVFDSDLASITPNWVRNLLDPVFGGYDFVVPDYQRHKLDGTITNTIAYNLTRALYGRRIRQPIGGDFGISLPLVRDYLQREVWETDVARFGIDIWMTTTAIVSGYRICQARLGSKIHGEKDPAADLGPMFRQVVGTIFQLMEDYETHWRQVQASTSVPTLGDYVGEEPPPLSIDQESLIDYFRIGFRNFGGVWHKILERRDLDVVKHLARHADAGAFTMPVEAWVRTVYRYMRAFHTTPRQRMKLLDTMIPLYYGRVASLVNELRDKDAAGAEEHFEQQARMFESMKGYLLDLWEKTEGEEPWQTSTSTA